MSAEAEETGYGTNEDFSNSPSSEHERGGPTPVLQRAQTTSTIISLLLSPVAIILVSMWASALGGVSWTEGKSSTNFNWHPVLMITAYALMNVGSLTFRVTKTASALRNSSSSIVSSGDEKKRGIAKLTHASIWSSSFILGIMGVYAVFKSHNDAISGYIANLYSLHSWVGILVLSLYTLQFLFGVVVFGLGRCKALASPVCMEIHKYSGAYIHILTMATILLGIQEKEGFVSCSYTVTEADLMPISHYGDIPYSCKVSHGLGIVVLAIGMCTSFALARFPVL